MSRPSSRAVKRYLAPAALGMSAVVLLAGPVSAQDISEQYDRTVPTGAEAMNMVVLDNIFIFFCAALVFLMQAGFGLVEAGLTRAKNAANIMMKNLMDVTGLSNDLVMQSAPMADREALLRIHPSAYLDEFKRLSDAGGGELGRRTPFGPGGFELAALSTGLAIAALNQVLSGQLTNAYALSRPPGHHCLPDDPNGFCLFNNIAVAIEAARASGQARRFAVLDWDVHHGNGTEAIFYDDPDVLTVSIHQDRNYP